MRRRSLPRTRIRRCHPPRTQVVLTLATRRPGGSILPRYSINNLGNLPPTLDIPTAAKILGLSRTKAYQLAKEGKFPCRVLKIGYSYRVSTQSLLRLLEVETASKST
ncbi:helix-turn-helix domain-containing protein [Actinocorallia populi]|uniref:helix-turn-helix domain-containing protein n=1 Tax=Actinocorallia populi TaxID=2079200 RepID=UPI002FCDC59B